MTGNSRNLQLHTHGLLLCGFETAAAQHGCKFEPKIDGQGLNTAPLMSPEDMGKTFRFDALSSNKDIGLTQNSENIKIVQKSD